MGGRGEFVNINVQLSGHELLLKMLYCVSKVKKVYTHVMVVADGVRAASCALDKKPRSRKRRIIGKNPCIIRSFCCQYVHSNIRIAQRAAMNCAAFVFDAVRHEVHSGVAIGNAIEHCAVSQCGAVKLRLVEKIITTYLFTDWT